MSKQETFSVSEIKRLCAMSEYLDEEDIHQGDKTVSFDGNIVYYKNKKPKANGCEIFIPIQIKGKQYKKLPTKKTISYPVDMIHINNYFSNGGVLFFLVAMEKETFCLKIYAKILLPIDIQELKKGKEEQKKISITLNEINGFHDLEILCDLFETNRLKQSLVILGAPEPNYANIREFSFSTTKSPYLNPAMAIAKSPLKYVYAKQNGIEIPLSISSVMTSSRSDVFIAVDNIKYTFPVESVYSLDDTVTTINNLVRLNIDEKNEKMNFSLLDSSDICFEKLYDVSIFLLSLGTAKKAKINNSSLSKETLGQVQKMISKDYIAYFNYVKSIGELLNCLEIPMNIFLVKDIIEAKNTLSTLKDALINHNPVNLDVKNDCGIYYQKIGNKKIVLEYEKNERGLFSVCDYLKDGKQIAIFDGDINNPQQISKWFSILPENISNTIFNKEQMIDDMINSKNEKDMECLILFVLALINNYDHSNLRKDLDFADKLLSIVEQKKINTAINTINRMQIHYRKGTLNSEHKNEVERLKNATGDFTYICCACILLNEYDEFEKNFNELLPDQQEEFKKWPIYNLLPETKNNTK